MSQPYKHSAQHHARHHAAVHSPLAVVTNFVKAHLHEAQTVNVAYGVPVSVVLAQSGLESAWGTRVVDNAYFGVKGQAPSGASTHFKTHEFEASNKIAKVSEFRAYNGYLDAAMDYGRMLRHNTRFAPLFVHSNDGLSFAAGLGRYATDPQYTHKLQSIIKTNQLT